MILKRSILILLVLTTIIVLPQVYAQESSYDYRKGIMAGIGIGGTSLEIRGDVDFGSISFSDSVTITGLCVNLELGYGITDSFLLYTELNSVMPRIGIGYKWYPNLNLEDRKFYNFTSVGYGGIESISYTAITGGVGYELAKFAHIDASVSYHNYSLDDQLLDKIINFYSWQLNVMIRFVLW